MKTRSISALRRDSSGLRIPANLRDLIDRAAQSIGKTRKDFILETARNAAADVLLDRALLATTPKAYATFLACLNAAPKLNKRRCRTMLAAAPWNKS